MPPEVFTEALREPGQRRRRPRRATTSAQALEAARRGRLQARRTTSSSTPNGKQLHGRVPDERAALREDRAPLPDRARQDRHRRSTSARSTRRNTRTACAAATSTSSTPAGRSRCRRATSSSTSSARPSADREGSRNYGGDQGPGGRRADPDRSSRAKDRDELIAATKALDRVLLWNHYVVPGWTLRAARIARWDRFGHPDPLPEYSIGFPTDLVVGRGQGGEDRGGAMNGAAAHAGATALKLAGAGARSRRRCRPAPGPPARPACTGCRCSAT